MVMHVFLVTDNSRFLEQIWRSKRRAIKAAIDGLEAPVFWPDGERFSQRQAERVLDEKGWVTVAEHDPDPDLVTIDESDITIARKRLL